MTQKEKKIEEIRLLIEELQSCGQKIQFDASYYKAMKLKDLNDNIKSLSDTAKYLRHERETTNYYANNEFGQWMLHETQLIQDKMEDRFHNVIDNLYKNIKTKISELPLLGNWKVYPSQKGFEMYMMGKDGRLIFGYDFKMIYNSDNDKIFWNYSSSPVSFSIQEEPEYCKYLQDMTNVICNQRLNIELNGIYREFHKIHNIFIDAEQEINHMLYSPEKYTREQITEIIDKHKTTYL